MKTNSSHTNVNNIKVRKIHSAWFFINVVNLKLTEHGRIHKIFHVTGIKNVLEIDNLEDCINNISF